MNALLETERVARKEGNVDELKRIFQELLNLTNDTREKISLIKILSVRRGQNKECIRWLINEVYASRFHSGDFIEFCKCLLEEVVEGRLYLEEERLKITTELKKRFEEGDDKKNALDIILNVPVETFTLVSESLIIHYQLEQFRLCVELKDWIRADITMKKIRKKYFSENEADGEKILFYKYIVMLYLGQRQYKKTSETYLVLNQINESSEYVVLGSFMCLLTTCESEDTKIFSEKLELLSKLKNEKSNESRMRAVIDVFIENTIIPKDIVDEIEDIVSKYIHNFDEYKNDLISSIDEHNLMVIEKYYSVIDVERCSELMNIAKDDLIKKICFMVNKKFCGCRINQRENIIKFNNKNWKEEVGDVLNKLIKADHLIHKERLKLDADN